MISRFRKYPEEMHLVCPACKKEFTTANGNQIYCRSACRHAASRRKLKNVKQTPAPRKEFEFFTPPPWKHHEVPMAIVTHPERFAYAVDIGDKFGAEAIVVDDGEYGCEYNHLRAWEWLASGSCPWSVVIEDDAVPIPRFRFQMHSALQRAPTPIVSFYLGRNRPPHWQSSIARTVGRGDDACYLRTGHHLLHGVGYAIRTDLIPDMLKFVVDEVSELPIDEAISKWAEFQGHLVSHTWPSLLDHRDGKPIIGDRQDGQDREEARTAWQVNWRDKWEPTVKDVPLPQVLGGPRT